MLYFPLLLLLAQSLFTEAYQMTPTVIQGGMGIRISSWQLAREVAKAGELGVISGTGIDSVFVRELQNGDKGGHIRRALANFPDQEMATRVLNKYFIEGGKAKDAQFRSLPMWNLNPSHHLKEVNIVANFCEVWLAKHNEDGSLIEDGFVGINRLTKVQLPTLFSLYGAMLADVDYVLMGAGIPLQVPAALDHMAEGEDATFPIDVENTDEKIEMKFSPTEFWSEAGNPEMAKRTLKRPAFLPIVSSVVLAQSMLKRASGKGPTKGIDGFVVELPTAGGHNAPPRGFRYDPAAKSHQLDLNEKGEPVYGPKDSVDLSKFKTAAKGLPFWLAGSYAHSDKVKEIVDLGGAGVQVGTVFALSKESGMDPKTRSAILEKLAQGTMDVFTDPAASPTGYPFKVLKLDNTLASENVYNARPRICSMGYLRQPYKDEESGKICYKCPAEPVEDWVRKGGDPEATVGRKCLCNALMANVGLGQIRRIKSGNDKDTLYEEDQLITIGDEVNECKRFMKKDDADGTWSYSAQDVVSYLKSELNKKSEDSEQETSSDSLMLAT